jgi:hypothetical protein
MESLVLVLVVAEVVVAEVAALPAAMRTYSE